MGKSTDLKLLAQRALRAGYEPRDVLYLSVDLLAGRGPDELYESVVAAKRLARSGEQCLVLLDEVTVIENWDEGIKSLWDDGVLRQDIVVCTGSSAADLREKAAERWPGRRGAGEDHLVLPQSFAEFARAIHPSTPKSPGLDLGSMVGDAGWQQLQEAEVYLEQIREAFDLYLRFGGLPAAVAEASGGRAEPSAGTIRIFHDSMLKEVARRGFSEVALHALLERVGRSLSSKTNWNTLARELDRPLTTRAADKSRHETVQAYLEFLAVGYFILILYAWKADLVGNDVARDKKLYFADTLIATATAHFVPGLTIDEEALVENAVALALMRRYEEPEFLMAGFHEPRSLHFWVTQRGGEIDFQAGPRNALDAVECKWRNTASTTSFAGMRQAFGDRPMVLASKNEFDRDGKQARVPAPLLCWALG